MSGIGTGIGIVGTGSYLPSTVVANDEVAERAGVTAEWIHAKTGIVARRRAGADEATSDLAVEAGRQALRSAGVDAEELAFVVVATSTPDHPQPATASIVQHRLGAANAGVFDVNAVCAGFVYALRVTQSLLAAELPGARGLVIGADVYSRILDHSDRRTAPLFGDGAGAVVLGPIGAGQGLLDTHLIGHGHGHRLIGVHAGGSRRPASPGSVAAGEHFFAMDGRAVRQFVGDELPGAVRALLHKAGLPAGDVRHFVPHQANGRMIEGLGEALGMTGSRTHLTVERFGNTGAASIPITLDAAHRAGDLAEGDLVMMAGFGGGMNIGASLCAWGPTPLHAPAGRWRPGPPPADPPTSRTVAD